MKGGTNCTQVTDDVQGNGPTNEMPDSTTEKLEELRYVTDCHIVKMH